MRDTILVFQLQLVQMVLVTLDITVPRDPFLLNKCLALLVHLDQLIMVASQKIVRFAPLEVIALPLV